MSINTNPLNEDGKGKSKSTANKNASGYSLKEIARELLGNSDSKYHENILAVNDIATQECFIRGQDDDDVDVFNPIFIGTLERNGLIIKDNAVIEKPRQIFKVFNPMNHLKMNRPTKPYRRNRRKVHEITEKEILNLLSDMKEDVNDTYPVSFRETLSANPEKDKVVFVTNVIYLLLTKMNDFASPSIQNISNSYNRLFEEIVSDIENNTIFNGVYSLDRLVKLLETIIKRTADEMDMLYKRCYVKAGLPVTKNLATRKTVKVQITQEPIEIQQLHLRKDSDMVKLMELQEYYNIVNVI